MRQNDIEKIIAYQKCFIGPLVWKCFTNNFELLLSEKEFPTFCTFFMYINVHGHQIFAKCTLNECTKMELDPPLVRPKLCHLKMNKTCCSNVKFVLRVHRSLENHINCVFSTGKLGDHLTRKLSKKTRKRISQTFEYEP